MERFQPVNSPKIKDLIIEQIRNLILNREISPSEKLPTERELMAQFKASRVVVREALKSLEAAGLVVVRPGSGTFVAEADCRTMSDSLYSIVCMQNTSLDEITEARLIFEPPVAKMAARRITAKDVLLLEENIENTERVLMDRKPTALENVEFHSLVAACVHNTVISLTMKTLLDVARARTIETSGNVEQRYAISLRSHEYHKLILEALKSGDSEKTHLLMLNHIEEVQQALRGAILPEIQLKD